MEEKLITIGVAFVAVLCLTILSRKALEHAAKRTEGRLDDALVPAVAKILKVSLWIAWTVFSLQTLGVNVTAAYAGLGVVALAASQAFAMAVKGVAVDIVSGIRIAFSPPFKLGEDVSIGKHKGKTVDISLTTTVIEVAGETEVFIPNSLVVSSVIERPKKRERHGKV